MNIARIIGFIQRLLAAVALALGVTLAVPATAGAPAAAVTAAALDGDDVIKTTDGRTLRGTIVREVNGYIWIDLGVGDPLMIRPDEIKEVERDAEAEVTSDPVLTSSNDEPAWERREGVTRAAVITVEGTVGVQMSSKPLRDAIPVLKEDGVDLVVVKVNSGGGMIIEIQKISDVFHELYKDDFQMVVWVESAISAAAMSTIAIEELYFMPRANFGACTGWFGALTAVEGRGLEQVLYMMEKISARGNKDYRIMRAMQINEELSYDITPDGERLFYLSNEGDHMLNDGEQVLTLNAQTAEHAGFSQGTAGTLEELTALLEKSVGEIEWVGEKVAGEPFPVSEAEKMQRKWREDVTFQEQRFGEIYSKYEMEIGNAASVPVENRGGFIRQAGRYLQIIRKMTEDNPNFALIRGITEEWFIEQERRLRELRR
ncbi:MAG: hypothetical protein AAFR96_06030 [Planctomycetota bacterium]